MDLGKEREFEKIINKNKKSEHVKLSSMQQGHMLDDLYIPNIVELESSSWRIKHHSRDFLPLSGSCSEWIFTLDLFYDEDKKQGKRSSWNTHVFGVMVHSGPFVNSVTARPTVTLWSVGNILMTRVAPPSGFYSGGENKTIIQFSCANKDHREKTITKIMVGVGVRELSLFSWTCF